MSNKEIQKQRMMRYFIDAAKEIIEEEGVKGLTARKVGQRAGYSYATIYNYFNDLNTLLTYCVLDFLEDCYKYMMNFKKDEKNPIDKIINYATAYFEYFIKKPDMFQLIFLEDIGEVPEELLKNGKQPSVGLLLKENILECVKAGYIKEENAQLIQDLIGYSLHGKLLFHLKRRNSEKLEDIIISIKNEIEFLLK